MPRDGSGVHSLPIGYLAVAGQTIQPSQHNPPLEDISAALTDSIARTGVTAVTADIPFGGFKLTGVGDPTSAQDAVTKAYGDANYADNGIRNAVINGDFRVNQRSYAGAAVGSGVYTYDRWKAGISGVTYSVSNRVATITAGALVQVIEAANLVAGNYTISWVGSSTCTVDGVAKVSGDTFAYTSGNCTLTFSTGTLSNVQVEIGTTAKPFELRPISLENKLCEYYYQFAVAAWTGTSASGSVYGVSVSFPRMRGIPTPTLAAAFVAVGFPATAASYSSVQPFGLVANKTASATTGAAQWGDTIALNAEL